jgi:acyl-coenzyme A thioesterase PaaI-like protein
VLRDLMFDVEVIDDRVTRGRLAARGPDGSDVLPFGVVSTAVDVLAGAVCGRAIAPDWMATSVMSLHVGDVDAVRDVELDAVVLRAGRSTVTVEVDIVQEESVGSAVLTFSRLPRRESTLVLPDSGGRPGDRYGFGAPEDGSRRILSGIDGFDAAIGCRRIDGVPGRTETDVTPYIRNSFGAVNGGVVAAIAAAAARSLVPESWRPSDLTLNLLGQGRDGPVTTTAALLRSDGRSGTVRVDLFDTGQSDDAGAPRLMAVAHVVLGPN